MNAFDRDKLYEAISMGTPVEGEYLKGLDLSGLDLGGANMRGSDLSKVNLTDTNLEGEKLVMVDVEIAGQETERMFCSKAVSQNLRDKEITAGELMSLPIALVETEDGRQFYQLQMPSRESNQLKLGKDKAKKPKVRKSVAKFEDLVAY